MERGLTFEQAQHIVAAAAAKARAIGVPMAIAVVDAGGHLIAFGRMDGAGWATATIAQAMAETAAAFGIEGARLKPFVQDRWFNAITVAGGQPPLAGDAGIPIVLNGRLEGAIGVSGGSGAQDRACALAGLAAIGLHVAE
ncbi:MAG: heme-binding protein [Chloroflexota bacterium]|nr:heme-binding protein [Dehalococcoidia bacterium]MDW8252903.1 heme-binding protein [Chloroflexota bacterium]